MAALPLSLGCQLTTLYQKNTPLLRASRYGCAGAPPGILGPMKNKITFGPRCAAAVTTSLGSN